MSRKHFFYEPKLSIKGEIEKEHKRNKVKRSKAIYKAPNKFLIANSTSVIRVKLICWQAMSKKCDQSWTRIYVYIIQFNVECVSLFLLLVPSCIRVWRENVFGIYYIRMQCMRYLLLFCNNYLQSSLINYWQLIKLRLVWRKVAEKNHFTGAQNYSL